MKNFFLIILIINLNSTYKEKPKPLDPDILMEAGIKRIKELTSFFMKYTIVEKKYEINHTILSDHTKNNHLNKKDQNIDNPKINSNNYNNNVILNTQNNDETSKNDDSSNKETKNPILNNQLMDNAKNTNNSIENISTQILSPNEKYIQVIENNNTNRGPTTMIYNFIDLTYHRNDNEKSPLPKNPKFEETNENTNNQELKIKNNTNSIDTFEENTKKSIPEIKKETKEENSNYNFKRNRNKDLTIDQIKKTKYYVSNLCKDLTNNTILSNNDLSDEQVY